MSLFNEGSPKMSNEHCWRGYTRALLYIWPIFWVVANAMAVYGGSITPFGFPVSSAISSGAVKQYLESFNSASTYYFLFSFLSIIADSALFCLAISFKHLFGVNNFRSQLLSLLIMLGGLCGIVTDISWSLLRVFSYKYLAVMSPEVLGGFWNILVWTYHLGLWISCYGFIMAGGFGVFLIARLASVHAGFKKSWIYLTYIVSVASMLFAITTIIGTVINITNFSSAFALVTIVLIPIWAIWMAQQVKYIQPAN